MKLIDHIIWTQIKVSNLFDILLSCSHAVEEFLIHDVYMLVALTEQHSNSEQLKQVSYGKLLFPGIIILNIRDI